MEVTHATTVLRVKIKLTVSPASALQALEDQDVVRVCNSPDVNIERRRNIFLSLWIGFPVYKKKQIAIYLPVNNSVTVVFDVFATVKMQILARTNLLFHNICNTETEFFLVVWLTLKNMTFTLTLLNESSTLYQKKEDEVIHEVLNVKVRRGQVLNLSKY